MKNRHKTAPNKRANKGLIQIGEFMTKREMKLRIAELESELAIMRNKIKAIHDLVSDEQTVITRLPTDTYSYTWFTEDSRGSVCQVHPHMRGENRFLKYPIF